MTKKAIHYTQLNGVMLNCLLNLTTIAQLNKKWLMKNDSVQFFMFSKLFRVYLAYHQRSDLVPHLGASSNENAMLWARQEKVVLYTWRHWTQRWALLNQLVYYKRTLTRKLQTPQFGDVCLHNYEHFHFLLGTWLLTNTASNDLMWTGP